MSARVAVVTSNPKIISDSIAKHRFADPEFIIDEVEKALASTAPCGHEGRIVQLYPRHVSDQFCGQFRHLTAAAEEMPAVEHDADVPKPACFDHGYRGSQIRNGAPGKELEVDRQPPRGCTFTKRTKSIGQEAQVFCRRKRRNDIH
jgi:hypothetical protein